MSSGAMFTAVTGTNAQQKRIDVIAHNLANVGTVGFKRQQAQFEDLLYENVRAPDGDSREAMGERSAPAVPRVIAREPCREPAQARVQGRADVQHPDREFPRQQGKGSKHGLGILFLAQVAHDDDVQPVAGLGGGR